MSIRMSTWLSRLVFPLAFGLAFAFILTGAWEYYSARSYVAVPGMVSASFVSKAAESWAPVILDQNILGLEVPDSGVSAPEPVKYLEPFAPLLLGTVTGTSPRALLRAGGNFLILDPGALIDGWVLSEVHLGSVVFISGDRRNEVLLWQKTADQEDADVSFSPLVATPQPWSAPAGATRVSLSRQDVQPILSDPNALLQMASFKPFSVDGRVGGFQVLSIRPNSLLSKIGLRNGDVLARIDGQTLTGPTQLLQAYSGMNRASLITLDVQRASQMQTYLVELN
ncbi:general secretion pathway protein C [Desulfonatronum thiosulfatophilum]|uniref:General secretion pathway protein C n=2 Tax=Desulfonatronum thiosulfatophilum TaxID=617002 RepID=A0A1G6E946_9BACT|nr:general secretion pathway protein C [Desulfonatronum thiosulfatophilum]